MASNIEEAAKGTKDVSVNMSEVSVAATKTGQVTAKVEMASSDVGQQSEVLHTEVEKFLADIKAA